MKYRERRESLVIKNCLIGEWTISASDWPHALNLAGYKGGELNDGGKIKLFVDDLEGLCRPENKRQLVTLEQMD